MADSNIGEVLAALDGWIHRFNFTRPGREQSLGRDVAMTVIRGPDVGSMGGMMGRIAQEVTPDGSPWPKNSDNPEGHGYASEKQRLYGWSETNRRTSQMVSQQALYGRTRIEPDQVTLVYGEDRPPDSSKAPTGYLSHQDESVTDVQKAVWATNSGRGFYGIGAGDAENVSDVVRGNLIQYIHETNQSRG